MMYEIKLIRYTELKKKARVNKFQRRLVWTSKEKKEFIDTLKKGYPFGSILIYKYKDQDVYSIIDGLQRFTTIDDYTKNPHHYITEIDDYVNKIGYLFDLESLNKKTKHNYYRHIREGINKALDIEIDQRKYDDLYHILYNDELLRDVIKNNEKFVNDQQHTLQNLVRDYLNVDDIEIPCIEFLGDETELATVFENLNRGGRKLSKYQVFSAQWSHHRTTLNELPYNNKILNINIDRYNALMKSRSVEIQDFDEIEMRNDKEINLSEFCYALGVLIINQSSVFWSNSKKEDNINEDLANEIGYSSLAIALKVRNNSIHDIPKFINFFSDSNQIEDMISKILGEYKVVNDQFSNYLRLPGVAERYESKVATNFQIMSYFSALWTVKYKYDSKTGDIESRQGFKRNYDEIRKNFILYYIYDVVTNRWSGTGDKKLNDIYMIEDMNKIRYLFKINIDTIEDSIIAWNEENTNKSSINFDNISKMLYVIYLSFDINNHQEESYDYEHIFPRAKYNPFYKKHDIPLGSLGNLMLLDTTVNKSKQDNHIYGNLKNIVIMTSDFREKHEYPNDGLLKDLDNIIRTEEFNRINEEIKSRSSKIINRLIKKLKVNY